MFIIFFLGVFCIPAFSLQFSSREGEQVCGSMRIINRIDALKQLEKCVKIDGSLSIVLMENNTPEDFADMSFPLLTEIRDFLLIFRVVGLVNVGKLFPNLAVIGGRNTVANNTLVLYNLENLREIGLYSLKEITHGQVYIDNNPSLCSVNTIDWDLIVQDKSGKNIVRSGDRCEGRLEITEEKSNSLTVQWRSQINSAEFDSHYAVYIIKHKNDIDQNKIINSCYNDEPRNENEMLNAIKFEDALMNFVYLKRPARSVNENDPIITKKSKVTIEKLAPCTFYDIKVETCRNNKCSENNKWITYLTKRNDDADKIKKKYFENGNSA